MLRVLDLVSGIGGFSLGLERAGMETVAFCEIDPYCRAVLKKHWPEVPCYDDITTLTANQLAADGIAVDVICGGFPCQDISLAGRGGGIAEGTRSGLWSEYARLIGELRPRYVIVENVAALLGRGLDRVLGDLAALGFDAEWHCIPASAIGAPHRRDRLWIVAHSMCHRHFGSCAAGTATPDEERDNPASEFGRHSISGPAGSSCQDVADAPQLHSDGGDIHRGGGGESIGAVPQSGISGRHVAYADSPRLQASWPQPDGADGEHGRGVLAAGCWWGVEPNVGRVAHGVPKRVDRLRALGNAVVPQIPEMIGRAILHAIGE